MHGGVVLRLMSRVMGGKDDGPTIRGVDLAGEVEAVGKDITDLRPGDLVFGNGRGTLAEYAIATERGLLPKPTRLSFAQASAVGVAGRTALQGLRDHGGVQAGTRVLIYGAGGGVGTFAVQIAKALGAHVTAVTGPRNLDLVRALDPDELVDYTTEDVLKRPERYDLILDVAATRPLGALRRALSPAGTLVMVGAAKRGGFAMVLARIVGQVVRKRLLRQRVVMFVAKTRRDDLAFLKRLIDEGKLTPIVDREYPLSEAREAFRYAGSGRARAKVVVNVS
jgi:NADPH:quinone reductase-like Zn-dependent oxidoreductase